MKSSFIELLQHRNLTILNKFSGKQYVAPLNIFKEATLAYNNRFNFQTHYKGILKKHFYDKGLYTLDPYEVQRNKLFKEYAVKRLHWLSYYGTYDDPKIRRNVIKSSLRELLLPSKKFKGLMRLRAFRKKKRINKYISKK